MNNPTHIRSASAPTTQRIALVSGWVMAAMVALTMAARAETVETRVIESRLVNQLSSTLLDYARRVETLSRDMDAGRRVKAEAAAYAEYDRLVWQTSILQAGRSAGDSDEGIEIQEMISVYRGMHNAIAAASRAGDRAGSAHQAALAATVVDAIQVSLRRIDQRNYAEIYERAFKVAAAN